MSESSSIRFVKRGEIDPSRWDETISKASNGMVYGFSFYLDQMAEHWDALVMGGYKAVMPLTWKNKFGINYLTQPFLTAQLGVFGENVDGSLIKDFLSAIPSRFKYWDIYLNHGNVFDIASFNLYTRSNYVLKLAPAYENIFSSYNENTKRNIKKAQQSGCSVVRDIRADIVIDLAVKQMKIKTGETIAHIERFRKLYSTLHARQMAITYGIVINEKIVSAAVFFYGNGRTYYILVGNDPAGRATGSSHALIDAFIKDHAGNNILLDFEGSDIPSLATFYAGFGAVEEKYAAIRRNNLPFFLKWMKK